MPVIDQMPGCIDRCFVVVCDGGIGEQSSRRPVDEHQRRTLLTFYMKVALILGDRVQDHSIDPPPAERIDHGAFAMRIVVGTGCEDCGVPAVGYGLDSTIDRGTRMDLSGVGRPR